MMDLACKWNSQQLVASAPNHTSIGLLQHRRRAFSCGRPSRAQTINAELQTSSPISGPTPAIPQTPIHSVTVHDRQRGVTHRFLVPEDQYILHTAEAQDITLPFACRHGLWSCDPDIKSAVFDHTKNDQEMKYILYGNPFFYGSHDTAEKISLTRKIFIQGCCTSCAVRVKSGQIRQPEALGISAELKDKGYALLCVGFPSSDVEVETQDEDEVYWLQFGRFFARGPVERDDYALELAMADE